MYVYVKYVCKSIAIARNMIHACIIVFKVSFVDSDVLCIQNDS